MSDYNIEGVKLGHAESQAVELLKANKIYFMEDYEKKYKSLVRLFYKWNSELEAELLKPKEGAVKDVSTTQTQKQTEQPQPSPKQKICPICKELIPASWKNHGFKKNNEICGWVQ